jgi:hypothetical protein
MNRHDAGLWPRRDPSGAAPWRGATDLPAMRVLGAGGGWDLPLDGDGTLCRRLRDEALRRCLTQRGELQRRVDGASHQLAERALVRAARCGQRGEHVFGNLRSRSDGTAENPGSEPVRSAENRSRSRFPRIRIASDLAKNRAGTRTRMGGGPRDGVGRVEGWPARGRGRVGGWPARARFRGSRRPTLRRGRRCRR